MAHASSSTNLQGVRGLDVDADQGPSSGGIHLWSPDLLIVAQLVSGENREYVSPLLVPVVVEGHTAGHWHCGHG